ncbi:hypothetical protein D9756_002018 [Leucocoprinus leucothites]|uniref:Uncharacterized protein n=1 Tax=Leucocoprinus leucothites TaxID=201217 RepID=A0A8H5GC02_9AGAR|nr:hypothetical protein D9756_002018 [Leucoagaricus leucothites]
MQYEGLTRVRDRRKQTILLSVHSFFIVFFSLVSLISNTGLGVSAFTDHHEDFAAPLRYLVTVAKHPTLFVLLNVIAPIGLECLVVGMEIWRVSVIWSGSPYGIIVTTIPLFMFLAALGLDIPCIYWSFNPSIRPNQRNMVLETSIFALGTALTIYVFVCIIWRLIFIRRRNARELGTVSTNCTQYTSITSMLIESYALMAASDLSNTIATATSTIEHPAIFFFISFKDQIRLSSHYSSGAIRPRMEQKNRAAAE